MSREIKRAYQDSRNEIRGAIKLVIPEGCTESDVARFLTDVSADLLTQFIKT